MSSDPLPMIDRRFRRRSKWNRFHDLVHGMFQKMSTWRGKKRKRQTACKPGSVPGRPGDGHSSGTPVAGRLVRPTRTAARKPAGPKACRPYLVLLPVGFAVPSALPSTRCALTAPFHPYPSARRRIGGLLSVALSLGSPPPGVTRHRVSVEPGLSSPRRLSPLPGSGHPAIWRGS